MRIMTRILGLAAGSFFLAASSLCWADSLHTPSADSADRKAILEAMQNAGEDKERVFTVQVLNVHNGWAWVQADPETLDRANQYETELALMEKKGKGWQFVDTPCSEATCSLASEITRIRKAHPQAPADIFPSKSAQGNEPPVSAAAKTKTAKAKPAKGDATPAATTADKGEAPI